MLPPGLFALPSLEWLVIQYNEGVWAFPQVIPKGESGLLGVFVRQSGISGTVPRFLLRLAKLEQIDLEGNNLEGSIPDALGSVASLHYLNMGDNNLNGTLPPSLGYLSSLTTLALGKNRLQGPLPPSLGNLNEMKLLDLSYNEFEGEIPASFSNLSKLRHVSLQHNTNLHGSISAFEPLNGLQSLVLNSNNFSSTIPAGLFSDSAGKIFVDLGHNSFTGKLPQSLYRHASNTSKYHMVSFFFLCRGEWRLILTIPIGYANIAPPQATWRS